MVAQIDEQHPAMVADAMAPARQPNGLADIALTEGAAGVGPVTMHEHSKNSCRWTNWQETRTGPAKSVRVYPRQPRPATECAL